MKHPETCFPSQRLSPDYWSLVPPSVCIGSTGRIRLCAHKTLSQLGIRLCIAKRLLGQDPIFIDGCNHEDHTSPCGEGRGPQAFAIRLPEGKIVLLIFWRGHSGSDHSVFHASGYLYRKKVEDAIKKIRLSGGSHLVAQPGLNSIAEWDAITEIDGSQAPSPDLIKLRGGWASMDNGPRHGTSPFRPSKVSCGHCEKETGCIVLTYMRRICFHIPMPCGGRLHHDWFHAIDRTSYLYSGFSGIPETCCDTSCRNHYSRGIVSSYPLVNKFSKE